METIQVVLDSKLLRATDVAARRTKLNRSALIRAMKAAQENRGNCPDGKRRRFGRRNSQRRNSALPS
jgi:metal-responsive CopG/Arc/MetJ family transcriptional regulator